MYSDCFSKLEIDAIGEILNISLGASATAVSTMLNSRVDITTPVVNVVRKEEFEMDRVEPAVCVEITYVEGLEGENVMLLKRHDIKVIVELVMGMEIPDEQLKVLRGQCVQDVKKISGSISLDNAVRYQRGGL